MQNLAFLGPILILALTACSGGGGGNDSARAPIPPTTTTPPDPIQPTEDQFLGLEKNAVQVLDVLANDGASDAEVMCVSRTQHGAAIRRSDDKRSIIYTPALGFTGVDRFVYQARDIEGNQGSATVEVRVDAQNNARDLAPATGSNRLIESDIEISELWDYATPSVLTPGFTYRFSEKPVLSEELRDEREETHVHRLPLESHKLYAIHVVYRDEGWFGPAATSAHPDLILEAHNGELVGREVASGTYEETVDDFRPARTETHYLRVRSDSLGSMTPNRGAIEENNYTIEVEVLDDNAETWDTQAWIGGAVPVPGRLERIGDKDWFRVSLSGGVTHELTLVPEAASQPKTISLRRHVAPDVILASASSNSTGAVKLYANVGELGRHGDYLLVVEGSTGSYEITTTGGDVASDVDTHANITIGDNITGFLGGPPDADWYRAWLAAGDIYRATVYGRPLDDRWVSHPAVEVRDDQGRILYGKAVDFDVSGCGGTQCSSAASVAFVAPYSGKYFISAGRFQRRAGGLFGLHLMDLANLPGDDFRSSSSSVGWIATERLLTGVLGYAHDRDWFRTHLSSGEPVIIHVDSDDLSDLQTRLINEDGTEEFALGTQNADGSVTLSFRELTRPQTFAWLEVSSRSGATGSYRLRRENVDPPPTTRNAIPIGLNGAIQGQIATRLDEDVYRLDMLEGHTYRASLEPHFTAPVPAQDHPKLETLGSADDVLQEVIDPAPVIEFTATDTGPIFFRVSNANRGSGAVGGAYLLKIRDLTETELCEEF